MLNGYQVIDADSHVIEPPQMWSNYLEPEFKEFAPSLDMKIQGRPITKNISQQIQQKGNEQMMRSHPQAYFQRYSAESHIQAMVLMGVDIACVYPTYGLWLWAIDDMAPPVASAFTRAYNTWLFEDFCSYDPARLKGVGVVNLHQPETLVAELRRIVSYGSNTIFIRPNPIKGRLLSDPVYEPFWRECESLDISVGIHEGTHSRLPTTGSDRFSSRFALHACSHPMEQMMAFLDLIEGGVLERHSRLKIGFLESGCGWLPYWLWRLDQEYENLYWEVKESIKLKPSEYFRRQCFISIEPSEPYLHSIIEHIGANNLLLGSDYPHMDHNPSIYKELFSLEPSIASDTLRKILWENPQRFYNL